MTRELRKKLTLYLNIATLILFIIKVAMIRMVKEKERIAKLNFE